MGILILSDPKLDQKKEYPIEQLLEVVFRDIKKCFNEENIAKLLKDLKLLKTILKKCTTTGNLMPDSLEWGISIVLDVFSHYGTLVIQTKISRVISGLAGSLMSRILNDFPWLRMHLFLDEKFQRYVSKCFLLVGTSNEPPTFFMEELVNILWCISNSGNGLKLRMIKLSYIELLIMCAYHKPRMRTGFLFFLVETLLERLYEEVKRNKINFSHYLPDYALYFILASGIRAAKRHIDNEYFIDIENYNRRVAMGDQFHVTIHCLNCLLMTLRFDTMRLSKTLDKIRKSNIFIEDDDQSNINEKEIYNVQSLDELVGMSYTIPDIHQYRNFYDIFTTKEMDYELNKDKVISGDEFFIRLFKLIEVGLDLNRERYGDTAIVHEFCQKVTLSIKEMSFSNSVYLSFNHDELMKYVYEVFLGRNITWLGASATLLVFSMKRRVFCPSTASLFPHAVYRILKYLSNYKEITVYNGPDDDDEPLLNESLNMFKYYDSFDEETEDQYTIDKEFTTPYYTIFSELIYNLHFFLRKETTNVIFFYNSIEDFKLCLRKNNKVMQNNKVVERLHYLVLISFEQAIPSLANECLILAMEIVKGIDTSDYSMEIRASICALLKQLITWKKISLLNGPRGDGEPARVLLPVLLDTEIASHTGYSELELQITRLIIESHNNAYNFASCQRDTINLLLDYEGKEEIDILFSYVNSDCIKPKFNDYHECLKDVSKICDKMVKWIEENSQLPRLDDSE